MGGEAFSGLTTTIRKEEVAQTLNALLINVLKPVGIDSYVPLGSTGKKAVSGDIDIAIGPVPTSDPKALKAIKDSLLKNIQAVVGADKAKLVGQNIALMVPIAGSTDRFVQVDVMLSGDPQKTGWLMSGTGEGVKGVYRNLMLSYIAKLRSEEQIGTKITISFPGGVQMLRGTDVVIPRTEDPEAIISALGLNTKPSEITTFEDLVTILVSDPSVSNKLPEYETYIGRYLQDPRTALEAQKSLAALKTAQGLRETVRLMVKRLRKII